MNLEALQVLVYRVNEKVNRLEDEINRRDNAVQTAIMTAVHELIDYLRHDDIQFLDEEEFSKRIKDLLWEQPTELPF